MVKRRKLNQFKRMKTPRMSDVTRKRRRSRAGMLADRFEKNPRLVEKCVFQDEKDFTLEVPTNAQNNRVYGKGGKKDVPDDNLFHHMNRQSKKVMVSACLSWNGATKPFFVNSGGVKVNANSYKNHLEKELLSSISNLFAYNKWTFLQDSAPSHGSNLVQNFLQEKLGKRFFTKLK